MNDTPTKGKRSGKGERTHRPGAGHASVATSSPCAAGGAKAPEPTGTAGGLVVLQAAFNALAIDRMQASRAALREGVLYDLLGRAGERDPRDSSVDALMTRYGADREQAARVEHTTLALLDQVAQAWHLDGDDRRMLAWAARTHELGLAVAHSQHHLHGAYLIEHSNIADFSRSEQHDG